MHSSNSLKVVSVTGAHSSVGKTTLCSILLRELEGFGAVKFTKTGLYTSIVSAPEILGQKGKDTATMLEAGAEKVVWIKSPKNGLKDAMDTALTLMTGLKGIVTEGNSPVDFLIPCLIIFIIGPDGDIKPSALEVCKRTDIVVINSDNEIKRSAYSALTFPEDTKFFRINLKKMKGEIEEFLSYVKAEITGDTD